MSRVAFALSLILSVTACTKTPSQPAPRYIIDTHIHLYDPTRPQGVPWPAKDTPLYRPYLAPDFEKIAKAHQVRSAVIVEASEWVEDNDWLLKLIEDEPQFVGVVGNLRPGTDEFKKHLQRFSKNPRFVGIRPRIDKPLKLTDERVLADLKLLAAKRLALDMLAYGGTGDEGTLAQLDTVAREIPSLTIVINHLAGVTVDGQSPDPKWIERVKACARHPNVYCKISGLDQQAGSTPASTDPTFYKPVLDELWNAFGADRLIYGSNWPVTTLRIDYGAHQKLIHDYFASKGEPVLEKVFWKNAVKAYRLKL